MKPNEESAYAQRLHRLVSDIDRTIKNAYQVKIDLEALWGKNNDEKGDEPVSEK